MRHKLLLLAALAASQSGLIAEHADYVTVNATAAPSYVRPKLASGAPKPETYVFYEGKFFSGATRDPSMARTSFAEIVKNLAPGLARQNYLPTKDVKNADLLIVVNWGMTTTEPGAGKSDTEKQFELQDLYNSVNSYNASLSADGGSGDVSDITANMMVARTNQLSSQAYTGINARLLGYEATLKKEDKMSWVSLSGAGAEQEAHLADLLEERYFVILLAYDYQKLLKGNQPDKPLATKPGEPQKRPIWVVRVNIAANGNNFPLALPAMTRVAADYFGKQVEGLKTEQTDTGRRGTVEIGDTKVMNVVK